jgi:NitT/TauT family transport system substrate-binding protein
MPGYHLPYFTAVAKRIFERHGLDVEIVYPEPGPDNVRAVARGSYDFCLTSVAHFMRALTEDGALDARFVHVITPHTHMGVMFVPNRPTRGGKTIRDFSDLDGASFVGDSASPFTREYLHLMRVLGLPDPPLVEVPYAQVKEALGAGEGDVTADFVDLLPDYRTAAEPSGHIVDALPFHRAGIDTYGSGLVAGNTLIETNVDLVRRLIAAIRAALEETRRDPLAGAGELIARFPEAGLERTLASWRASESLIFPEDGAVGSGMEHDKWARTIEHHALVHGSARAQVDDVFAGSHLTDLEPSGPG